MRRGLATALAAAGLLNLWAVSAGPLAQEPSQTGTFAYHCTIHPFMHGTIVVAAAGGSSTGSSSSSSKATPAARPGATTTTAPTQSKSGLPNTGIDVGSLLLSGALMLGAGLLL